MVCAAAKNLCLAQTICGTVQHSSRSGHGLVRGLYTEFSRLILRLRGCSVAAKPGQLRSGKQAPGSPTRQLFLGDHRSRKHASGSLSDVLQTPLCTPWLLGRLTGMLDRDLLLWFVQYPLYWWSPDVIDVPMEDLTHHTGSGEAFMPHSESLVGVSLHGSRRGGPSLHGSVRGDSTHHSRVSYIDLSTDAGGGSAHGRRPRGEMYAPVRHHIIQFPMHVLQAEGALGGGLEPDVVMDHPTVLPVGELKASQKGEEAFGKKLVLPDGDRGAIPPMERVEGWVENDARGPFERRQSSVRQEWMEQEGSVRGGEAGRPSEARDSAAGKIQF
jgi:hypothetical protein